MGRKIDGRTHGEVVVVLVLEDVVELRYIAVLPGHLYRGRSFIPTPAEEKQNKKSNEIATNGVKKTKAPTNGGAGGGAAEHNRGQRKWRAIRP